MVSAGKNTWHCQIRQKFSQLIFLPKNSSPFALQELLSVNLLIFFAHSLKCDPLIFCLPFSLYILTKMPDVVTIWRQGLFFGPQKDFLRANFIQSATASTWATWTTSRFCWQLILFLLILEFIIAVEIEKSSHTPFKCSRQLILLPFPPCLLREKRRMCQQEKWNSQLWISFIWQPNFLVIPWFLFKPSWFTTDRASQVKMNSIKYETI